jgi:uncharacterized membrane-anchored protein
MVAENGRDAVHPLSADHADLDEGAVLHRRDYRSTRDGEGDMLGRRHTLGEDERKRFAVRLMGFEALRRERVEEAIAGLRVR